MDNDTKTLIWTIGIVIGIFVVLLGSKFLFQDNTSDTVTIDDLHQQNIEGKETETNYMYNGYSFVKVNGLWYTQVQQNNTVYDIPLHFGPKELEDISISGSLDTRFFQKDIYVTFNPVDINMQYIALGSAELSLNMVKGLGIIPHAVCDRNETEACANRQIVTCDSGLPAVYLRQADSDKITLKGNCALIEGKEIGLVKAVDKFVLMMYGIMQP